jgi:SET domain-containing protein
MLLVKTYLDRSPIHGIGLFAAERIEAGTVIWRRSPEIDLLLEPSQLERLAPSSRAQIEKYTYLDHHLRKLVLCGDDARFFNHAEEPNCHDLPDADGGTTVAARTIEAGEELTSDYASFDASHEEA